MRSILAQIRKLLLSCAMALFGRDVVIEGRTDKVRLLPLIWKGRLHLLGLDGYAHFTSIEFVTPQMVRLVDTTLCEAGPATPVEEPTPRHKIAHVMFCHLPAPQTLGLLDHHRKMSENYDLVLAYGGPREEFDKIEWDRKFFLKDSVLRGPTVKFTYNELLPALVEQYSGKHPPDWIFIGDYDLIPLRYDYLEISVQKAREHKKSFAAKEVRDITASNCGYITGATLEYRMGWLANDLSARNIRIYQCLGAALLFTWDCLLGMVANQHRFPKLLFEVGLPTYAMLSGHSVMAMETCSQEWRAVRYRPVYPVSDLEQLQAEGVPMVHPVKDIEAFLREAPALQKRAASAPVSAK